MAKQTEATAGATDLDSLLRDLNQIAQGPNSELSYYASNALSELASLRSDALKLDIAPSDSGSIQRALSRPELGSSWTRFRSALASLDNALNAYSLRDEPTQRAPSRVRSTSQALLGSPAA